MLVLSRKAGERIQIGDDITVEVRRIAGNRVTIALAAPRNVRILRGELDAAAREFESDADSQREQTYNISHHRVTFDEMSESGTHELVG